MASNFNLENESFSTLQRQLRVARDEINNLRKEIKHLKCAQHKEMSNIKATINTWKCSKCRNVGDNQLTSTATGNGTSSDYQEEDKSIELQPIGFISTGFERKRAVPRQTVVNLSGRGKIMLSNSVFTNPEHSLEGLDGFSHMWIVFHFHKNHSNHIRAKVAPPRLNGARVGVFGTRSPHRPCPIGLSLVQIDKIEGSCVYFSGVDMLDGTPVLDLKPYIPHYDNPAELSVDYPDGILTDMERLELDGQESDPESVMPASLTLPRPEIEVMAVDVLEREAPDGEEGQLDVPSPPSSYRHRSISPLPTHVRVPDWISRSNPQLRVTFSPHAEMQLSSFQTEIDLARVITDILKEDPRSVYLRDRYANQFYTFLINDFNVSCKFDDSNHSVKVFKIGNASSVCECGQPEWQCSIHSGSVGSHDTSNL